MGDSRSNPACSRCSSVPVPSGSIIHVMIVSRAPSGARLAYWNMLVPRRRPESLATALRPLRDLSAQLFARDQAFFYSALVVEEVV